MLLFLNIIDVLHGWKKTLFVEKFNAVLDLKKYEQTR